MKKLSILLILAISTLFISLSVNVNAMKRKCNEFDQPPTKRLALNKPGSATQQEKEPIIIDIKLNPNRMSMICTSDNLRTYSSLNDAYSSYLLKATYTSSNHPQNNRNLINQLKQLPNEILNENEKKERESIIKTWKESIEKNELQDKQILFCEKVGTDDEFSIANELHSFAKKNNWEISTIDTILKKQENNRDSYAQIISKDDLPKLFSLIDKISIEYAISMPTIYLYEDSSMAATSYDNRIKIALHACIICTNNEIEFMIRHELSHIFFNHSLTSLQIEKMKLNTTKHSITSPVQKIINKIKLFFSSFPLLKFENSLSNLDDIHLLLRYAQEEQADAMALQNSNVSSVITCLLKQALNYIASINILILFVKKTKLQANSNDALQESYSKAILNLEASAKSQDPTHPTIHERICYALSHIEK